MALKPFYTDESDVPEPLRDHYMADDTGRHSLVVDAVDGYSLENVSGLKSLHHCNARNNAFPHSCQKRARKRNRARDGKKSRSDGPAQIGDD